MIKYTHSTTYSIVSHQIFPACPSTANETCIWYQNHGKDDQGWTQIAAIASPDGSPVSDREPYRWLLPICTPNKKRFSVRDTPLPCRSNSVHFSLEVVGGEKMDITPPYVRRVRKITVLRRPRARPRSAVPCTPCPRRQLGRHLPSSRYTAAALQH